MKISKNNSSTVRVRTSNTNGNNTMSNNYNNLQTRQQRFVDTLASLFGAGDGNRNYTRTQVLTAASKCGMSCAPVWVTNNADRRAGRGLYAVPETAAANATDNGKPTKSSVKSIASAPAPQSAVVAAVTEATTEPRAVAALITEVQNFIPEVNPIYVPWGNFSTLRTIIKSKVFYPVWINGLSGNGKTVMVEQVCAKEGREFFRVNITEETDEDDLLGGFRLVNGDTVWQDGPVVQAMDRGAVLLLDEVDLGSFKIMCLQPVLEGRGIYLKKVNRKVLPAAGFNIFATANTKGQGGDNSERFAGTTILNEAFLERFRITIEQDYPPIAVEKKIVKAIMRECDATDEQFADALCKWADIIRKSYRDGATTEMISTRRLEHIVHAFGIFKDRMEAIRYCVARFPADVRDAFLSLYEKIDATVQAKKEEPAAPTTVKVEVPASTSTTPVDTLMADIKAMMDQAMKQSSNASYALNA